MASRYATARVLIGLSMRVTPCERVDNILVRVQDCFFCPHIGD